MRLILALKYVHLLNELAVVQLHRVADDEMVLLSLDVPEPAVELTIREDNRKPLLFDSQRLSDVQIPDLVEHAAHRELPLLTLARRAAHTNAVYKIHLAEIELVQPGAELTPESLARKQVFLGLQRFCIV